MASGSSGDKNGGVAAETEATVRWWQPRLPKFKNVCDCENVSGGGGGGT